MDNYRILTESFNIINGGPVKDLICEPSEEQLQMLREGNGDPLSEMRQVNSSAGLGINFWRSYELSNPGVHVEFEWRKRVPLRRGIPANIDVVVEQDDSVRFIESKFLEPYYSGNENPRDSYLDASKYSSYTKDTPESWVSLFNDAKGFEFYNVTQLCRHLLAISKELWMRPRYYQKKDVQLLSITWEMPDSLISTYSEDIREEFLARRISIREDSIRCERLLSGFIEKHLQFDNLVFRTLKYNDLINQIPMRLDLREKLKEQYLL